MNVEVNFKFVLSTYSSKNYNIKEYLLYYSYSIRYMSMYFNMLDKVLITKVLRGYKNKNK